MADEEEQGEGGGVLEVLEQGLGGGGSSRFLSRALAAARSRSSIESMMTTRHGDMDEVVANRRERLRTWSTLMLRASSPVVLLSRTSRSSRIRSGWLPA